MVHIGDICGKELLKFLISHHVRRDTQIAYMKGQVKSFLGDKLSQRYKPTCLQGRGREHNQAGDKPIFIYLFNKYLHSAFCMGIILSALQV